MMPKRPIMPKRKSSAPATTLASDEPASPASLAELARERPALVIGGGLLAGLLIGALMPRGAAGKLAKGAAGAAALGSEIGLSLARQARDGAGEASEHLRSQAERAGDGARRLQKGTIAAAGSASSAGLELARAALQFITSRRG